MGEPSNRHEDEEFTPGVRLIVMNLPEDEGEGLGFRLTRTLWDPYPWVREVTANSRADTAGLKTGDCVLQADGKDLLGMPVGQVAGLIRGDGCGGGVSLLVWNCGVDPNDDPELLWSCGGGSRGEKSRRALAGVLKALSCCVCAATATRALSCARSHLYCEACWKRLERCALCRENLPHKESPYARNLVAEQVFEAIATEYEIKNAIRKPTETASACASPNRSPNMSPSSIRKGQYQLSIMKNKKAVQFSDRFGQNYASDPNIHRSLNKNLISTKTVANPVPDNSSQISCKTCSCHCQKKSEAGDTQSNGSNVNIKDNMATEHQNFLLPHKLVARLRPASSLVDLQNATLQTFSLSRSLSNITGTDSSSEKTHHSSSLDNLKDNSCSNDIPVLLLPAPPIYVLACDHDNK